LASARLMDTILVLHQGYIVESGSHDTLMQRHGLYCAMWEKQRGFTLHAEGFARVDPERLQKISIFATLSLDVLTNLAEQFNTETFEAGSTVMLEGEHGSKFYIVVRGTLQVLKKAANGILHTLAVLEEGDYFGEVALLHHVPRTATVSATTNSQCLSLSRDRFSRLVETQPALRSALEAAILQRSSVDASAALA